MKKLVLIVDDSVDMADSLALAVAQLANVQPIIAAHPASALRLLAEPGFEISALITDLNLPSVDGLSLITQVRRLCANAQLPAILVTAQEHPAESNEDTLSKPNFVFHKPFSVTEVCRVLKSLLA